MKNNTRTFLICKVFLFGVLTGIYSYFLYKAKTYFPKPLSGLEEKLLCSYPSFVIFSLLILSIVGILFFRKEIKRLWTHRKELHKKK